MNDTLKVAGRIGAELGAAKAEVERMREVLSRIANLPMYHCSTENDYRLSAAKAMAVAALSQQAEPTDTYTAVDMATAAAQGFRDGQAAVEQAAAKDEKAAFDDWYPLGCPGAGVTAHLSARAGFRAGAAWQRTRPAQTEQQPVAAQIRYRHPQKTMPAWSAWQQAPVDMTKPTWWIDIVGYENEYRLLYAAPIAQTAPNSDCEWCAGAGKDHFGEKCEHCQTAPQPEQSGKFAMHQRVRKTSGSEWQGRICGTYSTALTPEGYAVESEAHAGSVQIYPAKALEAVE